MYLIWSQNGSVLKNDTQAKSLAFPVSYPSATSDALTVTLSSSAITDNNFATLSNVRLFLQGEADQLNTLLNVWPTYGSSMTPPRPELDGGIEISFDGGQTFTRLGLDPETGLRFGDPADASTWILLPQAAVTPGSADGVLGAIDTATITVRYRIPSLADQFQIFNVRLEAAFDVV